MKNVELAISEDKALKRISLFAIEMENLRKKYCPLWGKIFDFYFSGYYRADQCTCKISKIISIESFYDSLRVNGVYYSTEKNEYIELSMSSKIDNLIKGQTNGDWGDYGHYETIHGDFKDDVSFNVPLFLFDENVSDEEIKKRIQKDMDDYLIKEIERLKKNGKERIENKKRELVDLNKKLDLFAETFNLCRNE